ncbi:MAG: aspartate/glutamate racemase family protein [Clostridia bacterium]|jgi:aspartate racemase|nr:aspartate/glutamate racemase family protein [Clostridia bacterium]
MSKKTIGIIGGMGPAATVDLFKKIVENTDAANDAGHVRVYMDCYPTIPDRTKAILGEGESPVPYLAESAEKLAAIGADFLIMPCNTSHYFYKELSEKSPIPVMNMIQETAKELHSRGVQKVGVLATDGTVKTGIYQKELAVFGIEAVCPSVKGQQEVMRLIYDGVKADAKQFPAEAMRGVVSELFAQGAEVLVLGCSELPLGFERYGIPLENTVDAVEILARAAIAAAGYPTKNEG